MSTDYSGVGLRCDDTGLCPDGFACVAGECQPETSEPSPSDPDGGTTVPTGFAFQRQLVIDNNGGTEDLIDFPLLVVLNPERINYSAMQAGGQDLAFSGASGVALDHEIERWNPGGESIVWVRVDRIGAASDGIITMHYGDALAVDGQDAAGVWSRYQAVYHLGANENDSTTQAFHGTNQGTTSVEGVIGFGRRSNGVDQAINIGSNRAFVRNSSAYSASLWLTPDSAWAANGVAFAVSIDNGDLTSGSSRAQILVNAGLEITGGARSLDSGTIIEVAATGQPIPTAVPTWITVVTDFSRDAMTLYANGREVASGSGLGLGTTSADSNSSSASIGSDDDLGSGHVLADFDEVRLSLEAQSPAWIAAQHRSMTDGLVTYGAEQATE